MSDGSLPPSPRGITALVGFFWFGAAMCMLTSILLVMPGAPLDVVWRIKPSAKAEFAQLGLFAIPLMLAVGAGCAAAAIGLTRAAEWGRRTAITILGVNAAGDSVNAVMRGDWRTLIGLPISGLMICYLLHPRIRSWFTSLR